MSTQPLHPTSAEAAFHTYLTGRGLALESLSPGAAVEALLDFYVDVRFAPLGTGDVDMLLFQWGTYDWGQGRQFELDITRQLIWPTEHAPDAQDVDEGDEELWQLSLTFVFPPSESFAALAKDNRWCTHQSELADFRDFVRAAPAFQAVAEREGATRRLSYESAE